MALPPIPQQQPGLPPHRAQLSKLGERRASAQQPPLCDFRWTSVDNEDLSNSWPSATLRRHRTSVGQRGDPLHPTRRFLEQVPRVMTRSDESIMYPRPSALHKSRREPPRGPPHADRRPLHKEQGVAHPAQEAASPELRQPQAVPFSLRLTPEAILVIQKRNLEKQRSANAKRIFASHSGRCPRSSLQRLPPDVRELVKISLLNDQHRYDDMEYEDECCLRDGNEGLVRKCTEWLQGVEMAAGRGVNLHDKLQSLPHLNTF